MANQITDQRTLIHAADVVTPYVYVDLGGGSAGTLDAEIFVQGTGSVAEYLSSSLDGVLYNAGSAQNWSNNVFYIRINCGIVGLLATKAAGGFRIRFTGATVSNWFEVYVGGSDSWPRAIAGGWVTFVVDIEGARSTAVTNGWTNGTVPATSAIQRVGWAGITGGTMPRMADNTWMDAMYRLPDGSPGIRIEGRNGGATDWKFSDLFTQLGNASGVFTRAGAGGGFVCNAPIQIGINDATTHAFTDTNALVLWADQEFAPADLYGINIVGAATGTVNVRLGIKTGTGAAATGAQGCTITAGPAQVRWFLDADGADIDLVAFYGCTFIHGGDFQLDNTTVETISSQFIDCSSLVPNNAAAFQRNSIIDANTADGVAFITSDDTSDIDDSSFSFSDGHAIQFTAAGTFSFTGNSFSGYGADTTNDAAVYNNSGGLITLNVGGGGGTPTVRNGAGASTTINNNISVTLTGLRDNTEVRVYDNASPTSARTELAGIEDAIVGTTDNREFSFSLSAGTVVNIQIINVTYEPVALKGFTVPSADASIPIQQRFDRNYENP